jgi:hypothetical protein
MPRLARDVRWILGGVLVVAVGLGGYFLCLREELLPLYPAWKNVEETDRRVQLPGIRLPPARAPGDAALADEDEVIGVCVGGRARAYQVTALGGQPANHVINDVVGGRAVSVTYCDRKKCSRVFTGGTGDTPLDLDVGGYVNKALVLRIGVVDYSQETGQCLDPSGGPPLPFEELPHERTTWKAWRESHPETDVYVGDPPGKQDPGPARRAPDR